ncbi:MAG: family 43 glycosylhydrolase, partial [Clostridia bacterium]|nr:family 43 glycosylhydrolase [Clostridia bacterium]
MKFRLKYLALPMCLITLASCANTPPVTDGTSAPPATDAPTDSVTTDAVTTEAVTTEAVTTLPAAIEIPVSSDKNAAYDKGEIDYMFTESEYFHNYIEVFDEKGKLYRIGDPYVMRYDGMYYLYSSITSGHINGDIYVWRSENLVDWECRGICLTSEGENGNTYTAYAPEVVYYGGYFWLCEAPNGKGHYIFRSESPEGPFTVASSNLGKGIDGSFYVADNGELYFMYAKSESDGCLRYDKVSFGLDYDKAALPTGNGKALNGTTNGWTEGPGYFRRGDYFYLTYTGNHVRDKSYRVAYSYTTADSLISGLIQPKYNITIMSTDTPYPNTKGYGSGSDFNELNIFSGTGHSSNTVGPNLDSIYTAFHNEESGKFNRRMNITRYFTNGSYVLTDGLCLTDSRKPVLPDYIARSSDMLDKADGFVLSKEATEAVYTAEINFTCINQEAELILGCKDAKNYTSFKIENGKLSVYSVENGDVELLGSASISKGVSFDKLITLYVVNGSGRCDIYVNDMKKLELDKAISGGKIGAKNANISSLFFTNDAFGTSDFEAVKNLPCSFAAYNYLKEENRGFSIKNAKVNENGVRQGEKESTVPSSKYADVLGKVSAYTATVLEAGDWVKYAVNSGTEAWYAFNISVDASSAGCEFELIVDNEHIYS